MIAMTKKPAAAFLVAIVVVAALGLAACGGGSDGSSSSSTATVESSRQGLGGGAGSGSGKHPGNGGDGGHGQEANKGHSGPTATGEGRHNVPVAPLEVSGGGSAQFHVKGGDNSVQDYGEEAPETELRQAAEATHSLLVANVRGEWSRACGLLAASEQQSLESAAAQSPQLRGKGCAAALGAFSRPLTGSLARETTQVDAASLRRDGEQAFLIYVGAPARTVYAMPLRLEGGGWKPTAIAGVALPGAR
jgi:hypothetical protein